MGYFRLARDKCPDPSPIRNLPSAPRSPGQFALLRRYFSDLLNPASLLPSSPVPVSPPPPPFSSARSWEVEKVEKVENVEIVGKVEKMGKQIEKMETFFS